MHDCCGDVDRVPELLERVEREDDSEAWDELGHRLCLEHDLLFPAGFPAFPRLVRLASSSERARGLAGTILQRSAGNHGCDDLPADCADAITEFRGQLDRHLQSRPVDCSAAFRALLAAEGQYHWSAVLGEYTDDFYFAACPHCGVEVTIDRRLRALFGDTGLEPGRRGPTRPAVGVPPGTLPHRTVDVRDRGPRRGRGARRRNCPSLRGGRMPSLRQRLQHRGGVHVRQPPSAAIRRGEAITRNSGSSAMKPWITSRSRSGLVNITSAIFATLMP